MRTSWLAPVADHRLVRRAADAGFVQVAHHRVRKLDKMNVPKVQEQTLLGLVRTAKDTRFGRDHDFAAIRCVEDFQARVPVRDYETLWAMYWKDAFPNLDGVTWPGKVPYHALSSGTTTGTTKFVPVTWEMVRSNQKASFTTMALFRHAHPKAAIFTGKFFFLGGSTELRPQSDGSLAGDLSGIAAKEVADFLRPYAYPPLDLSLIGDWEVKIAKLAEASVLERITAVSGVPTWIQLLFRAVKELTGKPTVADVWPELRLVVHGGTKFDPLRDLFRKEIGSDAVHFCEVYPCSEGYVATEDPRYRMLRVIPDHGVFFEFIPLEEVGRDRPTRHTLASVELGVNYAVVMSSCAGAWAYLVGDTVEFERRDPPLIRFTGRTKYFLSAFGEHLIQEEVDNAVAVAARACGVDAVGHHVGPVFPPDNGIPGHHLFLVEFDGAPPADLTRFATALDDYLLKANEDYAAHRAGDLTMLLPVVKAVPKGGFTAWMKSRGKLGGQNKVPVMDNSGKLTRELDQFAAEFARGK